MKTKEELIKTIHVDKSNLEHIAKTKNINGALLNEIRRVMEEYKNQRKKRCPLCLKNGDNPSFCQHKL